jgi:predicted phage terminase large subunit-like protein
MIALTAALLPLVLNATACRSPFPNACALDGGRRMERTCTIHFKGKSITYSFFTFARDVLGYERLQENPHHAWCRELDQRHPRSLWLEPRYTYKSTVFTKSYPIWRLFQDPNLRILIVNATAENAEAFLSEIVGHYLRNEKLLNLYRLLFNTKPLDPLAAKTKSIILNTRTRNFSEPSIGTVGALGNLVSAHYDLIIVDDLCNIDDRESPSIREKKKRWFQDLVSVLAPDGELVVVGTHWHFDDVYSFIINELNPQLPEKSKYYIQRESCYTDDGQPRFPKILPKERLDTYRIEKGQLLFACQYLNQPIPTEHQIFRLEAMHKVPKAEINLQRAEAFAFCDPSLGVSDYSAIVTVLKHDSLWTVFHCDLSRQPHSKLIDKIIELYGFFNYKVVGIEANALGKAKSDTELSNFEIVLRERQSAAGLTVPYKLVWNSAPKLARIEGIEPHFSSGQLQFLETWNQDYPELIEQLIHFPLASHDDGPDALAGAIALIQEYTKARPQVLYPRAR